MTTQILKPTATILPFPVKRLAATKADAPGAIAAVDMPDTRTVVSLVGVRVVNASSASGWYHDAEIEADRIK